MTLGDVRSVSHGARGQPGRNSGCQPEPWGHFSFPVLPIKSPDLHVLSGPCAYLGPFFLLIKTGASP